MDELDEVLQNCPLCLHRRELAGEPDALYWICDCGIEKIKPCTPS